MVAAMDRVEIGAHCMLANGCFVTDANHRFDDPDTPITWQGFTSKGPTTIGDNVWLGANVVVTSGVTIGERCVIGANSVVTQDIPPFSIAAGAPGQGAARRHLRRRLSSAAEARPQRHHVVDVALRVVEQPALAHRGEALVVAGRRQALVAAGLLQQLGEVQRAGADVVGGRAAGRAGRGRGCG